MSRGYAGPTRRGTGRPPGGRANITVADWMAVAEDGVWLAEAAQGEGDPERAGDFAARLTDLRLRLRDLSAEAFPGPSEIHRLLAGAFLCVARAFAHAGGSAETRTACAGLLGVAAGEVDRLITLHRTRLAQDSWGRGQDR